ncbi:MFS general substrate transporter [Pyrrhoderma noxium]|uniref:MFS general substrate transporter n=1 Tax=Pyrrhoderma noxium TaxID=2282107 RepID=A0A286UJ02_9AGAM|nr:MFS general substrate transporter [Pyrrhoderma noxium]
MGDTIFIWVRLTSRQLMAPRRSVIWGCLADNIGRKLSWQVTLLLAGIFGIAVGASQSFTVLCSVIACVGFSIGGNLPVDGALFLESIPPSHQRLLTFLSTFWSLGQLIASLIIWVFLSHFSNDKNWRYAMYTINAMYGVLYAYTPEVFPAPHRGTGDALCSAFNRMMGISAPVIKILTSTQDDSTSKIGPNIPVFVSVSLFLFSAILSMLLPIETAGKAAL